jgi:hypothetical protein
MLKIGNLVQPKYRSKYVIFTECMHGDGDAYTQQEIYLEDETEAEKVLILTKESSDRKALKLSEENEELYDYVMALVSHDVTNCDVSSHLMWTEINYYDENGNIFEVERVDNE